jgi:anti-sigma B factor antagonist
MKAESERGIEFWAGVAPGAAGGSVVTVFGELDLSSAPRLKESLSEALAMGGDLEIDLRGCSFIDSSGIAVLAWAAWQLKETEREMRLRGARERIRNIFELTGLNRHSSVVLEPPGD